LETACIECGGLIIGEYARGTREHISLNDGEKIPPAKFIDTLRI
jgi:hypothetical protein